MQTIFLVGTLTATWRPSINDWSLLIKTSPISIIDESGLSIRTVNGSIELSINDLKNVAVIMELINDQYNKL